jgi:hypothetical protein
LNSGSEYIMWYQEKAARGVLGVSLPALSARVHAGSNRHDCCSGATLLPDGSLAIAAADCFGSDRSMREVMQ